MIKESMKKILVIGATSAIAEKCAKVWALRGDELFLVGRNTEKLMTITKNLQSSSSSIVECFSTDVNDIPGHQILLDKALFALKSIDVVLIAHGTLADQGLCENDVDLTLSEIKTNALSTIALLTILAVYFESKNSGAIAVISSIAGDRGRSENYVYGSSKAMITAFTSGLRQRLHKSNVAVTTIKPGLIDSPMTVDFNKNFLWVMPTYAAKKIVKGIDAGKYFIYVPGFWRLIMIVVKLIPEVIFVRISSLNSGTK